MRYPHKKDHRRRASHAHDIVDDRHRPAPARTRIRTRTDMLPRVPPLDVLRARRSEKWAGCPADVLPATVAEMDFDLAPPISETRMAAIDRSDLGYVPLEIGRLTRAFAGFARRRLAWALDPEQVTVATDVMVAVVSLCRELLRDGGAIAFASPNYPPYFRALPRTGLRVETVPLMEDGSLDLAALATVLAGGPELVREMAARIHAAVAMAPAAA